MPRAMAALDSSSATMARRLITGTSTRSSVRTGCRTTDAAVRGMPRTRRASLTEANSCDKVGKNRSATQMAMTPCFGTCSHCSAHAISPTRVVATMFDANMPMQKMQRTSTAIVANEADTVWGVSINSPATAMMAA